MPQMKYDDKAINVTDTGTERETRFENLDEARMTFERYFQSFLNPTDMEQAVSEMLEPIKLEFFATRIQQYLQEHDKDFAESISTMVENLEKGHIDSYVKQLETYAENLDSIAAGMARDVSMGAEEEADADKAIEKYNVVLHTITQIKNFPLATELQQHLRDQDKNFSESVFTISENLMNRNIDDYMKRLESHANALSSKVINLEVIAAREVDSFIAEGAAAKVVEEYNKVMDAMKQLESIYSHDNDVDIFSDFSEKQQERDESEPFKTSFFEAYEVASPIIHDSENYVVIHSAFQENSEAIANEVLYNPSENTFMFVDLENNTYLSYSHFSMVADFMTEQEIEKFNEVLLKSEEISVNDLPRGLQDGDIVYLDTGYVVDILDEQNMYDKLLLGYDRLLVGYDSSDGERMKFTTDNIESIIRNGKFIYQERAGESIEKIPMSQHETTEVSHIVKLTGLPVSEEMQDILQRLENKEYVAVDEINNTKEIKMARSNIDYSRPTIQLDNRLEIQTNVLNRLNNFGSAKIDGEGTVLYNGDVANGSRLDIVIGLPASGKSSAIVDSISQEFNSKVIDNDEAKKMIPQYNDGWGSGVVHEESQRISDRAFKHSLSNQENIVLPKVGSNADKLLKHYIEPAKEAGYMVNIHFVDLDRDKALGRMLNRFIEEGRFLDPNLIEKYAPYNQENHVQQSYEQLKENPLISGFSMWNNDVPRGERPILIEHENLTGNYIDNARKGDEEYGMETEHDRGREGEVVDGGTGRGNGREGRYPDAVGEEAQRRDGEALGNRPIENINGGLQNETVIGGAGQNERERLAGTLQVDSMKEELLKNYKNFLDAHFEEPKNSEGISDKLIFEDAVHRNDFNTMRNLIDMVVGNMEFYGSISEEVREVAGHLHGQINTLEAEVTKERQQMGNDMIDRASLDAGDKIITLYDKSTNEITFQQVFNDISEVDLHSLRSAAQGWDRYEVAKGEDTLFKGNVTDTFVEDVREGLDKLEMSKPTERVDGENTEKDIISLKADVIETFKDYINDFAPNNKIREEVGVILENPTVDFNVLRDYVDLVIDTIGSEDSDYVTEDLMRVADELRSKIDQLETAEEMSQHETVELSQEKEKLLDNYSDFMIIHYDYGSYESKLEKFEDALSRNDFTSLRDVIDMTINDFDSPSKEVTESIDHFYSQINTLEAETSVERRVEKNADVGMTEEKDLDSREKIANVVQMIKEADLSDFNLGEQLGDQVQAMLIAGKTDGLTKALSEFVFASEEVKQNILNAIYTTKEDIQNSIEKGLDIELFEEKMSLLLTGNSLLSDTRISADGNSFVTDFNDIINTFDKGRYVDGFERIGEEITFTIPGEEIRLCDIDVASSRYNLPDGYYVASVVGMNHNSTVAFCAEEIMDITFHSHPTMLENTKSTVECNPEFESIYADWQKILTDSEQEELLEVAYKCYAADDKQAYNVLLSSDPSKEYQERLQFYVEDTDGNAVASGVASGLYTFAAEYVMMQIGVFQHETDCITYRLRDSEEIQMMHERSQDITKLPCMVTLKKEYSDVNQTVQDTIFCADNTIASKISEYAMDEHERLQEYSEQDINLSIDIGVRPDIEEREVNKMLENTEQYRAYGYYVPEQDAIEYLLIESDKENCRITCTYYDDNLEKISETVLNYESRAAFGAIQNEFSIFELINSQEFRDNSDVEQNMPTFKPINADELRSDILDKQALKIGNDMIDRTSLDAGDKIITLYDKSTNEITFQQAFNDISEIDLHSLQSAAQGWDRYEVAKGEDTLFKGNVTDTFIEDVRGGLDEIEATEQETEEHVLGDRELKPLSNAELAARIAELIYAHDDNYMDISLDDIQADILNRLEDGIANGDVVLLEELSSRLEAFADLMTDKEKTVASLCADQLKTLERESNKSQNLGVSLEHEQAIPSGSASELFQGGSNDTNWTMKKLEENEEENYNFIDGTLNNVKPEKEKSNESLHDRIEENKALSKNLDKKRIHDTEHQHSKNDNSR